MDQTCGPGPHFTRRAGIQNTDNDDSIYAVGSHIRWVSLKYGTGRGRNVGGVKANARVRVMANHCIVITLTQVYFTRH